MYLIYAVENQLKDEDKFEPGRQRLDSIQKCRLLQDRHDIQSREMPPVSLTETWEVSTYFGL